MDRIFSYLFQPPDIAEGLLSGGINAIKTAIRLVYYRGLMDGFFFGCIFAILFTLRVGGRRCCGR